MQTRQFFSSRGLIAAALFGSLCALNVIAQVNPAPSRITEAVTNSNLVTLRGNVHPLALPEYDRGLAPASLPMERMMLLLKRSPQQEAALQTFLAQQQDRTSPNYHHWLTPEQFGAEFGPSDQDIQTIEKWLQSEGFSIDRVSTGRTVIEFSGSAGEVQSAFHTEIHRYVLPTGAEHWANSTAPQIPAALAPVVSGIRSLNDFHPRPLSHLVSITRAAQQRSQANPRPAYTFQASGPCSFLQGLGGSGAPAGNICFMVTPADFGVVYNVQALWSSSVTGTGETIAIANDSNINLSDISSFRSLMGLPASAPQVILASGTDPGVQGPCSTSTCTSDGDESEADLDVEWSGAIAPSATIDLVIAPSTNTSFGGDIAAEYIIDNNLAPILSYSFGACEAGTGVFYGSLWQQAAAEGITVLIASGDNGSAACDAPSSSTGAQPAKLGLAVSGIASTPNDVAVGGTDFNDSSNPAAYWSTSNSSSASQASAKGYIPENAWNDSCSNPILSTTFSAQFGTSQEAACNNATLISNSLVVPTGSSGGVSVIYSKPSWQGSLGPSAAGRELPDVSLFAGTGAISASFYYMCESDLAGQSCGLGPTNTIDGAGGTSVSAQAMAGIVALINQQANNRQGNINPALYGLASANTCPSSAPTATCIFYDVTQGSNTTPCAFSSTPASNSPNCVATTTGDTIGILESNGTVAYNADAGYDLTTGLGSINVKNLVLAANVWTAGPSTSPDFSMGPANGTITLGSNGQGTMQITITPVNGFTGSVNLSCPALPAGDTCSFSPASPVTVNGATNITMTVNGTVASVPGAPNRPSAPWNWPLYTQIALAFGCLAALLLFGLRVRRRRWNPALAIAAFTLFAIAGCSGGGGSSPGNNGGGGGTGPTGAPFMTTVTATTCNLPATPGCSTGVTHSLPFTIR